MSTTTFSPHCPQSGLCNPSPFPLQALQLRPTLQTLRERPQVTTLDLDPPAFRSIVSITAGPQRVGGTPCWALQRPLAAGTLARADLRAELFYTLQLPPWTLHPPGKGEQLRGISRALEPAPNPSCYFWAARGIPKLKPPEKMTNPCPTPDRSFPQTRWRGRIKQSGAGYSARLPSRTPNSHPALDETQPVWSSNAQV